MIHFVGLGGTGSMGCRGVTSFDSFLIFTNLALDSLVENTLALATSASFTDFDAIFFGAGDALFPPGTWRVYLIKFCFRIFGTLF